MSWGYITLNKRDYKCVGVWKMIWGTPRGLDSLDGKEKKMSWGYINIK